MNLTRSVSQLVPRIFAWASLSIRAICANVFTVALLVGCAAVPHRTGPVVKDDYQFLDEYLSWMIEREASKAKVHGVAVAVVDGSRVVWTKGYGWADAAHRVPVTPETRFRVGSVSKVFTATEIMRRVERGELDLDADISQVLPGFSIHSRFAGAKPITVRALLSHHSGLAREYLNGMFTYGPPELATLVPGLAQDSLIAAPQTQFSYSNLDFALLGRVIEMHSNERFATVIKRSLLDPLAMTRSTFDSGSIESKGYSSGKELPELENGNQPAGSLVSSASDLARFIEFVLAEGRKSDGQELIRSETLRSMFTPQLPGLPLDFGYQMGLGWMITGMQVAGAGPIAWHDGSVSGYQSHLAIAPESKLGVVVLANDNAAAAFTDRVGKKAIALALAAKLGVLEPTEPEPNSAKVVPIKIPAQALDDHVGDYVGMGQLGHISRAGDHLVAEAFGKRFDLLPIGPNQFVPEASGLLGLVHKQLSDFTVTFSTVEGRHFAVLQGLPQPFAAERITRRPLPKAWARRLGDCRAEASDGFLKFEQVRLEFKDGQLAGDVRVTSKQFGQGEQSIHALLDPVDDHTAVVLGQGGVLRVSGESSREKLFYSGYTFTCYHGP